MSRTRRERFEERPEIEVSALWEMYSSSSVARESSAVIAGRRFDWRDRIFSEVSVLRF